jgi:tetratricopeptide (TPR) repeat protein
LCRSQNRFPQAEDALRRSLAVSQQLFADFPQDREQRRLLANSHNNLAWFFVIRLDRQPHHAALALEHAQAAIALQPRHHDWWHTLGVAHCRLGHWKEALAAIEKSRELDARHGPPDSWDRFFEAMAYSGLGDKENARRCYEEGVAWMEKNAPEHRDLRRFRDEAAQMLGIPSNP